MRVLRRYAWMVAAIVAALAVDRAASAASTITVNMMGISRSNSSHPNNLSPNAISREDCINNDVISVPLTLSPPNSLTLQTWVSNVTDCTDNLQRSGSAPTCGQVYENPMPVVTQVVDLRVQDMMHALHNPGSSSMNLGTAADCTTTSQTSTAPQELDIYFMYMNGATAVDSFALLKTQFALLGPNAPNGFSAGPGDTFLKLSWQIADTTSAYGYYFYCDPPPGQENSGWIISDAAATGAGGASGAGGAGGASTCDASTDDSGDAAVSDASCSSAGGSSGSGGSGGSSGGTGACFSSGILEPGVTPDTTFDNFRCGQVAGRTATSGIVSGLVNDYPYLVSVAAYDSLGNIGALAAPACEAPGKTNDFLTVYRDYGGNAGDRSFCSVSGVGRRAPGDAAYLLAIGLAVASSRGRRRAQQRNRRSDAPSQMMGN